MAGRFDFAVIGGGILGASISWMLACAWGRGRVCVIEQEQGVAMHTSGRNTGKVHAPYLYDPGKKGASARAAFRGYSMWEEYAGIKGLPFRADGVMEVALDAEGEEVLERHRRWGISNGLAEDEITLLDGPGARRAEPNVRCAAALRVTRDASVDYAAFTRALKEDGGAAGAEYMMGARASGVERTGYGWRIALGGGGAVEARVLVNAAGGEAVDVAHWAGAGRDLVDVHFRGEYWKAPAKYSGLTSTSVYSVPEHPEYPFLDPHWIIRSDGSCEIGPNAVPVFSPHGYDGMSNLRELVPKVIEMLGSGARRAVFDRKFQELAIGEAWSSLSRPAMVERVRRFLPSLDPADISERGTAGIRSSVIDAGGRFVPDAVVLEHEDSFHILNYNSPGATGALPFAAHVVGGIAGASGVQGFDEGARCGPWVFSDVAGGLEGRNVND